MDIHKREQLASNLTETLATLLTDDDLSFISQLEVTYRMAHALVAVSDKNKPQTPNP